MLNVISSKFTKTVFEVGDLSEFFSSEEMQAINSVLKKESDNIIIRGLPVPENLPETPRKILEPVPDIFPARLVNAVADYLGKQSEKGIENTIRFTLNDRGETNVETWHGHPQYSFTVFFCLRGDENTETFFLSANDIMKEASEDIRNSILESALIKETSEGFEFSPELYEPSDFQEMIEDLDLPDTTKSLMTKSTVKATEYLLDQMKNARHSISYIPGDFAIYNERQTMRFSPAYNPSTEEGFERWLLASGVY